MAKKYHPDRVPDEQKSVASEKFTVIHQCYAILTNETTKKQYDDGDTDVIFTKKSRSGLWEQHLKPVSDDDFEQAARTYKNSTKEKEDIIREVVNGNGSMKHLLNTIPYMRIEDQPRILSIIAELTVEKKISNTIKMKKLN